MSEDKPSADDISDWAVDFIEGELDGLERVEMKSRLRRSSDDQAVVDSLQKTKAILKTHDVPAVEFSEDYLEDLQSQIMAKIEEVEIAPPVRVKWNHQKKRLVYRSTLSLMGLLLVVAGSSYISSRTFQFKWDIPTQIAQKVWSSSSDETLFMTYQSEHDFFVDVASQSLDHLSKEQFQALLSETKTR